MQTKLLSGKLLPVNFAKGYIYACADSMGNSPFMSFVELGASKIISDQSERENWLQPLYAYYRFDNEVPQPLDYAFNSLIINGLEVAYPNAERLWQSLTSKAGRIWWFKPPSPISPLFEEDTYSLFKLLSPFVWEKLNLLKYGYIKDAEHDHINKLKLPEDLAKVGFQTFLEELRNQVGIISTLQELGTHSELTFSECPFCLNTSTGCHVFLGLFQSFLNWLQTPYEPFLNINEEKSSGHSIVIDLITQETRNKNAVSEAIGNVLKLNPNEVMRYCGGEQNLFRVLAGKVFMEGKGRFSRKLIEELLTKSLQMECGKEIEN